MGENFITSVPAAAFGSTLTVNDLNLDHNYIESLGMRQFGSLSPRRLYLAHNRIVELDDNVFDGVEGTLVMFVNFAFILKIGIYFIVLLTDRNWWTSVTTGSIRSRLHLCTSEG